MSVIADVRQEREDLARVLKKHTGIRKIVEDLYPDSAHFIYELLQNAEDTGATEASFNLETDRLVFEHDGRPFSKEDILAITDIGEGNKAEDAEKIGRFGVGFKAVFAYSETPLIWSPTYSFKISELVLPDELPPNGHLDQKTRFEFPFNNPKKSPEDAYKEVAAGLNELAETTLLFLNNLETISWKVGASRSGALMRIPYSEHHIEVLKQINGRTADTNHFLKFTSPVEALNTQNVAIAYGLVYVAGIKKFDPDKPLQKQLKITPAQPGLVAVFFPAEKETSGLRFHLHAPFVPELSRASIKDTPANEPLFDQLSELTAASLHTIRNLGLLTREFLSVLPNQHDTIPPRYQRIHEAIVEELNTHPLTPIHGGHGHAPARDLLQARASLKNLLTKDDLVIFHDKDKRWAVSATQKNSDVDHFLEQLDIYEWDIEEWLDHISGALLYDDAEDYNFDRNGFFGWLSQKSLEWHQIFYATLYREFGSDHSLHQVEDLPIVRLENSEYEIGKKCFFPGDGSAVSDLMPRVDIEVYTYGKSKTQQQSAKKLLEEIGVREVGEREQVETILKQRYTHEAEAPDEKTYRADLKRFIALVESDSGSASLFHDYYVIENENGWNTPDEVFLDLPYVETGLTAYYQALGADAERVPLSEAYRNRGIPAKILASFASAIGVQTKLEIKATQCYSNPEWRYLSSVAGERYTSSSINRDYTIQGLESVVENPVLELSRLIWRTMAALPGDGRYLTALYRKNASSGARRAASQLVHLLKDAEWVPQDGGPFVRPAEASRDLLPEGFPFDSGWQWLEAIKFGAEIVEKSEVQRQKKAVAKELGFEDDDSLERAKQFVALLPPEEQKRVLADFQERQSMELPEHEPSNPERRAQRVGAMAADAPERRTEIRSRSVAAGLDAVKEEAAQYLIEQYTNPDGQMICQVCKGSLPFRLDDGTSYFEKVQFLKELRNRHYQNFLALCPNHAAMFQYAIGSRELMKDMLLELDGKELEIVLAQQDTTVYFTKTHLADLIALIEADSAETGSEEAADDDADADENGAGE